MCNISRGEGITRYHLVDSLHNRQHLLIRDLAISVNIIQLEGPIQFILHTTPRRDRERTDELLEINHAAIIRIEYPEDIIGKRRRVAKWEKLSIDLLKLLLGQRP